MEEVVERVEIPVHNRECDNCLGNALRIQAVGRAAQTLAGTDHVLRKLITDSA